MTLRKGCGGVFHTMAGYKHIFVRNRLLHFVLVSFLPCQAAPNTVWAQAKAGTSAPTVSVTPVSHDSETIGGEPELDLSTPDPEVSSVLFTFRPGIVSQWMIHTVPVHVYVLEGTLTVEFQMGRTGRFIQGRDFFSADRNGTRPK